MRQRGSNPTATVDQVHVRANNNKHLFDVAYSLDNLNRVRGADEGHSTGTAPALTIQSGYHTRNETWPNLTLTGNWKNRQLDSNGDGDVTDLLDRNEPVTDQVFNKANEWTDRHIEKAGGLDRTFDYTYDAVGNLIGEYEEDDLGGTVLLNQRGFVYDAFGRMVAVTGLPGEETTYIEKHRYNGLGFRTMWQYDVDVDGTLEDPERYYFVYDERWRVIGTFRNQDANPKEAFVHHAAGLGGFGGSSYIDSIIHRDRDNYTGGTPNPMSSAGDGTLEERRYLCQNWRADVVAITKSDGTPLEYVRYSAYGEPTVYPVADLDMDGDVDTADAGEWDNLYSEQPDTSAYQTADIDFDGEPSTADGDLFNESYTANTGLSGKGRLSSPSISNRLGYAGYHLDPVTRLYDVRHRWYFPEIGRWGRRDPIGYVDGTSLYEYVHSMVTAKTDSLGLLSTGTDTSDDLREYLAPCAEADRLRAMLSALEEAILDACGFDSTIQGWVAAGWFVFNADIALLKQLVKEAEIGARESQFRARKAMAKASRRGQGWKVFLANLKEAENAKRLKRIAKCVPLAGDLYIVGCGIANRDGGEVSQGLCGHFIDYLGPWGRIAGFVGDAGVVIIDGSSAATNLIELNKDRKARCALLQGLYPGLRSRWETSTVECVRRILLPLKPFLPRP